MIYSQLGRTGIQVSRICLGTMTWGRQNSEAEGHAQMDYAVEQGVNFFDTAELYAIPMSRETCGRTEEIIGTWFAARKNRDKIVLASKVAGVGVDWIRGGASMTGASVRAAIDGSLKRLQTDYIDLYQLHWPNREDYHFESYFDYVPDAAAAQPARDNFLELLEALDDLVKAGKVRAVGLSNETAWGTMEYLRLAAEKGLPRMASIQNEYSLIKRVFEPDLAEIAMHEDIGLLAWSPLAAGSISGKYLDGARPPGTRWSLMERGIYRNSPEAENAIRAYIKIAQDAGLDVCQMALAFVNSRKFLTSTIIGATTMEQLRSNIDSIKIELGDDVLRTIDRVHRTCPVPY